MATRNLGNVRALISSATPPTNKNLIWQDTSSIPYTKKVWNNNLLIWEEINPATSTGESNTASNVGLGAGLYKEKVGIDLRFKSITGGSNISISEQQDQVVISSSGKHSIQDEGTAVTPANILNFLGFVITYDSVNGKIVIDKGETSNSITQTLTELQTIIGYKDGNSVFVVDELSWYKFNVGNETGTQPGDGGTGSWVKYAEFSGLISDSIHNATAKVTPINADEFGIWDSISSALRKVTWANIKATLKTYFDTLYVSVTDVTSQMIANWNEAYGWGDHAAEGYLTTETDPVFTAHPASNVIDTGDGDKYLADDGIYRFVESGDVGYWEPELLAAATTEHPRWDDSNDANIYGRDKFGFNLLPGGGRRVNDGIFRGLGQLGIFWTSSVGSVSTNSWYRILYNNLRTVNRNDVGQTEGMSIRLVRPYTTADGDKIDGRIISNAYTDFDGNIYNGVIIGDQVWITSNLKTTSYSDGTPIPTGYNDTDWSNLTTGAYAVYDYTLVTGIDSEAEMIDKYGLLYNWYAVDNVAGLGDVNWHVPSDAEFTALTDYIIATYPEIDSTNVGDYLKSVRQVNSPFEYESDEILRPKLNLSDVRRKALPNDIQNLLGAPKKLKKINDAGDDLEDTPFDYDQIVQVADIDMTDVAVGESKILLAQKQSDGSAAFEGAVAQIDKIAPPGLESLLAPDQSGWTGDEITLSGDNTMGSLGVNSQEFYNDEDWFLCISHTDSSATWKRNRGQDCLNIGETTADAIIAELETESGWNTTANFKQITTKSKKGSWFRRDTGGYLYMCIDNNNGWIRVGTPDVYDLEISSASHPVLTANLEAHDFGQSSYLEGTDASDEPAIQGQIYEGTNGSTYIRMLSGNWVKTYYRGGYYTRSLTLSNAEIKSLISTPITLIPAITGKMLVVENIVLKLNAGTEVLTETDDNFAVRYITGSDISVIESTGFVDQSVNTTQIVKTDTAILDASVNIDSIGVEIYNNGDSEIAGNSSNDATIDVHITYRAI